MKLHKSTVCLNCNKHIANSNYCPECGQLNTHKKLPISHFFRDFFGDYFTFDSKVFKSLLPLIIRPGFLTEEYLSGRRVNYILPLRLYIFMSFLFFFTLALNTNINVEAGNSNTASTDASMDYLKSEAFKQKMKLSSQNIPEEEKEEILNSLAKADINIDSVHVKDNSAEDELEVKKNSLANYLPDNQMSNFIKEKIRYLEGMGDNGIKLYISELINQIPKVMFLLLPIFALLLKLLFVRRKILYVEHLVFAIHVHTFAFFILIFSILVPFESIELIIFLSILIYLLLSLYRFYSQPILKTFIKFGILLFMYAIVIIPAIGLLALFALASV